MLDVSTTLVELEMFQVDLERMEEERTVDFNFSDKFGTDYKLDFLPLDHIIGRMQLLVAEFKLKMFGRR